MRYRENARSRGATGGGGARREVRTGARRKFEREGAIEKRSTLASSNSSSPFPCFKQNVRLTRCDCDDCLTAAMGRTAETREDARADIVGE